MHCRTGGDSPICTKYFQVFATLLCHGVFVLNSGSCENDPQPVCMVRIVCRYIKTTYMLRHSYLLKRYMWQTGLFHLDLFLSMLLWSLAHDLLGLELRNRPEDYFRINVRCT